ncbi:MAG: tetratricopeptide repeat protein [Bacteroidota bacterium]|jgi:tetratricopeptide (TPR) repeat protein
MKTITFSLSLCLLSIAFGCLAESQNPSVQIVAKKKSGLFGMGSPKLMEVSLSNQNKVSPLTCDNVNGGKYIYFLCKTVGDWQFDADFVKDDLPNFVFEQGEEKLHETWKEDLPSEGSKTLALGFPKSLQLHQPFVVKLDIGDTPNEQEMRVPEELWPGYSLLTSLASRAESLANGKQYKEAIQVYNRIIQNSELKIFPRFGSMRKLRSQQFTNHLDGTIHSLAMTVAQPTLRTKEKIDQLDSYLPEFRFVVDSLPSVALQVSPLDSSVHSLTVTANDAIARAVAWRDSLRVVFDNQNTQWIVEGNLTGENAYRYQHIIPILAFAFSSLDFSDTATALRYTLTEDLQTALTKYNIGEPYESFVRVCSDRFQRRLPIFPGDFLANLRRDTSAFALPYYSMLKSIDNFYKKDFISSKNELRDVFRSCDNPDLLPRFHQLRILLDIKLALVPPVVISQLQEAKKSELSNDESGTLDHYKQAMSIAPTFAYPAYALAEYYLNAGFAIRAIPFFEKAYEIDRTFLPAYREEYRFYQKSGSYKPMIQILTQALQNGNDFWEINYNLGAGYMGDGDPVNAAKSFEHALALNPKSYQTTVQLGLAQQTLKNYPKAREYFNKAIELEPERPEAVDYLKNLDELQKAAH